MSGLNDVFTGVFTALVTPFGPEGIDFAAFDQLVEEQIAAGVKGLVPVGTTGEAATLSSTEANALVQRTVQIASGRAFVLAGAGSNSTAHAVEAVRACEAAGADGCLVVTPYYNKPSQDGLERHYDAVAASTDLPIVLYSVPGRCGVEIEPDTAKRLFERHDNIVGIKEAGGRAERISELRAACGPNFVIHSGDDGLTLPFLALGAIGVTSVLSNYAPAEMVALVAAWHRGDTSAALALHERIFALARAMFIESNPVPIKQALALRQQMAGTVRAPLAPLRPESLSALIAALEQFAGREA
ncbi:MAG TPA: 4-hydroxy-tetrahydrodipicolinate synthase [Devosia sp.]|jgi:4-hydroxy-tetrahydrodipicolinate synthase|uniref:4-hydroxy-tetrahydrodipicolinate synthase n=1 Tax=Devosia sp. TaxID=1871048 RepID=UPI002DDCA0A2|nr:4-hydroxy-tetrahydrodipicolinate synthase [Devosia sp.]HEV2515394.1 4-hydroxy-tetrahydrodipicolinate synthase [Devosia sp.]